MLNFPQLKKTKTITKTGISALRVLLLGLASLSCTFVAQAQILEPFSAKYVAKRNGSKIGFAELELSQLDANQYKLRFYSDASLFLIYDKREEISQFKFENKTLTPIHYAFSKKSTFKDSQLAITFDEKKNLAQIEGKSDLPWEGELDNQLYRLAAQKMLSQGKSHFEFDLINYRGEKKHYAFQVEATEMLELPFGKLEAIKIKTIRQNKKRVTFSWFAPELNYLMVRLQQFKEGNEQGDIQLSQFSKK